MIVYRCDCCGKDFYKKEFLIEYHMPKIGWKVINDKAIDYLDKSHTLEIYDNCAIELAEYITDKMSCIYNKVQYGTE